MKTLYTTYNNFAKRLVMSLIVLMTVGVGTVFADTYTWTLASGDLGGQTSPASSVKKGSPAITWNTTYTWGTSSKYLGWDGNNTKKGVQIGSGSAYCTKAVFSTSDISGTITNITVNGSHASSGGASIVIKVGGETVKSSTNFTTTATDYSTGTISKSGQIEITISNSKEKAFYLKSISITYTPAPSGYAVTWDKNGRGDVSDVSKFPTTASSLTLQSLSATGYTNTGWKANVDVKNGSNTIKAEELINNGTTVTLSQATTFTAQWTPKQVTITWNANGGIVTPSTSNYIYDGSSVTLPTPTRDGYNFKGWYTSGGTQITDIGTNNKPASDVTYYAQWTEKQLTNYRTSCADPCEQLGDATGLSVQTDYVDNGQTYVKFSWTPANNTKDHATKQVICIGKVGEEKKCTDLEGNQVWSGDLRSKLTPGEYEWTIQAIGDGETYCDGEVIRGPNFTIEEPLTDNCRWVEVTDNTTLEDGDEVVITMTWGITSWALPNNGGTSTPTVIIVNDVEGNRMLSVSTEMIWIVDEADGMYSFYPKGSDVTWLYCTNTNDGVRVGTGENKYFTVVNGLDSDSENNFLYNNATLRYVGVYHSGNDNPDWRCYKLTDKGAFPTNIQNQTLKFYKKTCLPADEYWINYNLSNVTCITNPKPISVNSSDSELRIFFEPVDGYQLPKEIEVKMGEQILNEESYTWDNTNGKFIIESKDISFVGDVTISIIACKSMDNPADLRTNVTSTTATLSWSTVENAQNYTLLVISNDDDISYSYETTLSETTCLIEGLTPNTTYLWEVVANGVDGYCDTHTDDTFRTLDVYTVTFNTDGGTDVAPQTVDHGTKATKPIDPTTTGYTFSGWYTEPACTNLFDFNTVITKNTTLYAKWTEWSYTITYAKGSPADEITGEHAPGTKMYTSAVTIASESFFRLGYKQTGWSKTDGGQKDYDLLGIYGTNEDVTLYPYWTKVHTITWMADGSTHGEAATYLDDETLALPESAPEACQGSAFMGWTAIENYYHATDAPTYVTAGSAVTTDAIYYAVYAEAPEGEADATYTLVTTANDFTDGIYVIAAKSNDYFYFINGQYVSEGLGVETTGLASNLVNDNSFAASILPGGAVELDIEDDGDPLGDNYYFISYYDEVNSKWLYLDDNGTKQTILWTDADEVYTYLPIFDNGKYYLQSGSGAKISQNGSNKASFIRNYASTGSFYNSLYFFKKSAGSIIYTNYSTICTPTYYITYDLNSGEGGCENGSVPADEKYTICANIPTKTGYDFVGWSTADDNEAEFLKADVEAGQAIIENVSNNVELYAVWEAKTYEITWWSNGVEYTTTSHTFDTELQLPADPYTCYGAKTFIGWTEAASVNVDGSDITYINENTNPSENKTYYAVFADVTSNGSGGYDKVTEALDDYSGEFLIVYEAGNKAFNGALSTLDAVSNYIDVTIDNNTIESDQTTDAAKFIITKETADNYSVKSTSGYYIGSKTDQYDNGMLQHTTTYYSNNISVSEGVATISHTITNAGTLKLSFNNNNNQMRFRYFKPGQQNIALYKKSSGSALSNYTTTPSGCAEMEVAENAYVTSANGQNVKVNVPVAVNFQDGYAIDATLNDGTKFEVVEVSAIADDKAIVTLAYSPDYSNNTEKAEVKLTAKYSENFVTAKSFTVNGRSLPETFAVVAKVGNMWYALPEVGYEAEKHATAYPVEVNDIADPTEVTSAVANNAAWSLRQVYQAQHSNAQHDRYVVSGANVVFENKQNPAKLLNASAQGDKGSNNYLLTSAQYDNYYSINPGLYEWTLATKDLETYTLTNVQRTDKQINISTNAAFGLHAADIVTNEVRFLPIQKPYTTLAAQVVEWKENSVVIMYNGNPAQTASVSVNGGEAQNTTLSSAQRDTAVYELTATGLAANPTQRLSITIGSEKTILSIPYIINSETTDAAILPDGTVAALQEVAKVSDLVILKGATLTAAGAKGNPYKFRNVTVYGGGKLVVPADNGFGVNSLTLRIGGVTADGNYDYVYPEFVLNTNTKDAYTNTSGKINLDYLTTKEQYYTFVAPFAVETKDIKYPVDIYGSNVKAANRGSFEFQYYDGEARANGEKGWKVVEEDPTDGAILTAHKGYTFYGMPKKVSVNGGTSTRQKFGIHRIPMSVAASTAMSHENGAQTVAISAHPSEKNINSGWNLIGNPYMATITGLNNNSIQTGTIVLVDDRWQWSDAGSQASRFIVFPSNDGEWYYTSQATNAELPAFKNFFVQIGDKNATDLSIPRNTSQAQLLAPIRHTDEEVEHDIEMAIVLEKDEANSDQMDFLINDAYGAGFDYNADFTKMMNNTQLNLYGVLMEDNLSFVALDHYSARGSVAIGYQVPSAGEYTLRISDKPYVMLDRIEALYVTDHEMNPAVTTNLMEEDYVFHVGKAEINDTRFTISLTVETNTNGDDITTDMGELDIHSKQPQKFFYDSKLYILRDGKIYSATGHEIKTINE